VEQRWSTYVGVALASPAAGGQYLTHWRCANAEAGEHAVWPMIAWPLRQRGIHHVGTNRGRNLMSEKLWQFEAVEIAAGIRARRGRKWPIGGRVLL
jgi:hypothetical protein